MSNPESSLPESWVERIWATMRATYGAAFDRQWECPAGIDPAEHVKTLKAHWGRELARYQQNPSAIRYGLENLPPHPPNLVEFRAACNRRPNYVKALPAPKADPARVAKMVDGIARPAPRDPKDWARSLQAREERGEPISYAQSKMWRAALGVPAEAAEVLL